MRLRERLSAIAAFVPQGARLADIGTDHAYVPIELVQNGCITLAVAGEIHEGPYQSAKETIEGLGLQDQISLRLGNGLAILSPGEVNVAIMAGMGGVTIVEILSATPEITGTLRRIIMQPMVAASFLRQWLVENKWCIMEEELVQEDGKLYEIIVAEPGTSPEFDDIIYEIGPVLWITKPPLLKEHIEQRIAMTQRIVNEMSTSAKAQDTPKYLDYCKKIKQLEASLLCL